MMEKSKIILLTVIALSCAIILGCNKEHFIDTISDEKVEQFDLLFEKWKTNIETQQNKTFDVSKLPEYKQLAYLGEEIVPLIIVKLINDENYFAMQLYDELQKTDSLKSHNFSASNQIQVKSLISTYMNTLLKKTHIKKEDLNSLGITSPVIIEKQRECIKVGFIPYAREFFLALNTQNAYVYHYLMKEAMKSEFLIKVYLHEGTNDVAFVENATEDEINQFRKSQIN